MSWRIITDDWRLKLLAVGLAVLMLGAVAFSQNPPTSKTLTVGISYTNASNNPVVLISPPGNVTVTVRGLADLIAIVSPDNLTATVDISRAKAGTGQKFNVVVTPTIRGLTVDSPAPIVLDIDTVTTKELPVEPKINYAPGWGPNGTATATPSTVHFTGPAGWMTNLHAYALYPVPVAATNNNALTQPIQLQNNTGSVDYTTCGKVLLPACSLDVTTVALHVDAVAGVTSSTVPLLDMPYSHPPASGYRVTTLTITPGTVIISGAPVQLAKVHNLTLPAVDLSGRTSDYSVQVNIPYPDGITGNTATATIKYSISANPNVSPSPTP